MTNDAPLFRDGKCILKARTNHDGTISLYKPFVVKPMHILGMTGTPGWDRHYVDMLFPDGQAGNLEYIYEGVKYACDIETFREFSFTREVPPYGSQYNVNKKHWKQRGHVQVSPLRSSRDPMVVTEIPKFAFGEYVPCRSCKGVKQNARKCKTCLGSGLVKAL